MSVVFFFLLIVGQFIEEFFERNISIEDVIERVLTERERSSTGIFLESFLWGVLLCIPKSDFSSRSSPIRGYTGN